MGRACVDSHRMIPPDQVHIFVPGDILAEGNAVQNDRRRIFFRDYRFLPFQAAIPAIENLLVSIVGERLTLIRRRFDEGWKEGHFKPGNFAIVGAGRVSEWEWPDPINVSHIYLSNELMASTAAAEFERDYKKLEAIEAFNAHDQELQALGNMLAKELRSPSHGGRLLVDSLASALSVHLVRHYHRNCAVSRTTRAEVRLTTVQRARVLDFIDANIYRNFGLLELAAVAGLSETHFRRCFRTTFGESPHQFVLDQRARLAVERICRTNLALAEIAIAMGFADQAHMTHAVKRATGLTPSALRKA